MNEQVAILLTRERAAALCSLTPARFSQWVRDGRLPQALPGTRRWHRGALQAALDKAAGVGATIAQVDEWEAWKGSRRGDRKTARP